MSRREMVITMDQLVHQEQWVPDKERQRCNICSRSFAITRRKHHCRTCGEVFCSSCLMKRAAELPVKGIVDVKVCLTCVLRLSTFTRRSTQPTNNNAWVDRPSYRETFTGSDDVVCRSSDFLSRTSHDNNRPSDFGFNNPQRQSEQQSWRQSTNGRVSFDMARSYPTRPQITPPDPNWHHPWPKPPTYPNERERLHVLRSYDYTDPAFDDDFAAICRTAASGYECPIAAVSFLEENRQWFRASFGLMQDELPREVSFCAHRPNQRDFPLTVRNTLQDPRFAKNPLTTGRAAIRFYASAPITSPDGHVLGSVLVMDRSPRQFVDTSLLLSLAGNVLQLIYVRPQAPLRATITDPEDDEEVLGRPSTMTMSKAPIKDVSATLSDRASSAEMEMMLVDLLRRTIETQNQLSSQNSLNSFERRSTLGA